MTPLCIVGLGNPGSEYIQTRHNIGWLVTDGLVDTPLQFKRKFHAAIGQFAYANQDILLVQPHTFMNRSGESIASVSHYYHVPPDHIWLVHDEMDLPFGTVRISTGRSAAGHRGVNSVYQHLNTQAITRFRIGIRPDHPVDTESYVLQRFSQAQSALLPDIITTVHNAIHHAIETSVEQAANKFN